jgi:hypothetical protein
VDLDILNAHNIDWRFYIVIKSTNYAHTDSPPPPFFSIPTIGIRASPSRRILTTGRRTWNTLRLEHQGLMVRTIPSRIKGWKHFYKHEYLMFGNK